MTLAPWEYLFVSFNSHELPGHLPPDLDRRRSILLVVLTVLYNVRTRALHRHAIYLEMWEWLWWTGLITFSLLIVESLFVFDFFLVLLTEIIGLGDAGLDPLLPLPAAPRGLRAAAGARALLHAARSTPTPRRRSRSAAAGRTSASSASSAAAR